MIDRVYHRGEQIAGLAKELTAELGDVPIEFGDLLAGIRGRGCAGRQAAADRVRGGHAPARPTSTSNRRKKLRIRFRIDGVLHIQTEADAKISSAVALRLEADVRPRYFRKAPAAGWPLQHQGARQPGRRAYFHLADPVRRIGGHASAQPEHRPARTGQDRHAGACARAFPPCPETAERHGAGHRPNRLRQDDDALCRAQRTEQHGKKVITVEDPVEYRLPGLNQVQVHEKIDLSFERVLRTVLRQDPDIVLVGEMRDQETAEIGMRAAMTGHLVLSTLHTNDAVSTPIRLLDMGVPRYMVALSLHCWWWPSAWSVSSAATAAKTYTPPQRA